MKKRYILGILLLAFIVMVIAGNSAPTKEVEVGTFSAEYNAMGEVLKVKLPENTQSVRVVYKLYDGAGYSFGSNGNIGLVSDTLQDGENPWMSGKVYPTKYLEVKTNTISGEFTFDKFDAKYFVYSGMFNGEFKIYATVNV